MLLSNDIILYIISYNIDIGSFSVTIRKDIIKQAKNMLNICLINKYIYKEYNSYLYKFREIYRLVNKYYIYQDDYEWNIKYGKQKCGSPQLYDIISTGCELPFAKSTYNSWDNIIIDDLYKILELFPTCLQYSGYLRCRDNVSILLAAGINNKCPINIIELLSIKGASWNKYVNINGQKREIIEDLNFNVSQSNDIISNRRYNLLKDIYDIYK